MTPCQRQKKQLRAYLDNELATLEKKEFETHLDDCPECGEHVRRLKTLRQSLKSLNQVPCDSNFEILLRERIRREMAGKTKTRLSMAPAVRWSFAVVAVLAISIGSLTVFKDSQHSQSGMMVAQETSNVQPAGPVELSSSSDQIQYVMDNFPEDPNEGIIAVRSDANPVASESGDSTLLVQNYQAIKNNIRTVSF